MVLLCYGMLMIIRYDMIEIYDMQMESVRYELLIRKDMHMKSFDMQKGILKFFMI